MFQIVPFEAVSFTVLNMHALLCKSFGSICELHNAVYESYHFHYLSHCLITAFRIVFIHLILLYVFPILGLFIHMFDPSSLCLNVPRSFVWMKSLC